VCRLNKDPELVCLEKEADLSKVLALRVLYGFLAHMDDLEEASPAGTYGEFVAGMDAAVRKSLTPKDVYEFVERLTGTGGAQRCFFLLLDEFSAVKSEREVRAPPCAGG